MIRFYKCTSLIVVLFISIVILHTQSTPIYAEQLLKNPGFEDGADQWSQLPGSRGIEFLATSTAKYGGNQSMQINATDEGAYGVQQVIVNIDENKYYQMLGWINRNDQSKIARLRVAWYKEADGTGSDIDGKENDTDTPSETDKWNQVSIVVKPPSGAKSAKIRLQVASSKQDTTATAYFDDISFSETVPPPSPTSVPTSTPTLTPTPTPEATLTPTPTNTPTPSPTKKLTPSPSAKPTTIPTPQEEDEEPVALVSDRENPSSTSSGTILGQTTQDTAQDSKSSPRLSRTQLVATSFIGGGVLMLASAIIIFIKQYKSQKISV